MTLPHSMFVSYLLEARRRVVTGGSWVQKVSVPCAMPRFSPSHCRLISQSICFDRFPSIARTAIPGTVDYPITNAAKSWQFVQGLMYLAYGLRPQERLRGMMDVLFNLGPKSYRKTVREDGFRD